MANVKFSTPSPRVRSLTLGYWVGHEVAYLPTYFLAVGCFPTWTLPGAPSRRCRLGPLRVQPSFLSKWMLSFRKALGRWGFSVAKHHFPNGEAAANRRVGPRNWGSRRKRPRGCWTNYCNLHWVGSKLKRHPLAICTPHPADFTIGGG